MSESTNSVSGASEIPSLDTIEHSRRAAAATARRGSGSFRHIAAFEWRLLRAERTLVPLALIFTVAVSCAALNGRTRTRAEAAVTARATAEETARLAALGTTLDSLANDSSPVAAFGDPRSAYTASNSFARRYAILPPEPLAALAIGQSDLFTSYYRVSMMSRETFLANDDPENPSQLAAGSFDMAFVVVTLFPLLIIAFTFDMLSAESEGGTLALLLSQPLRLRTLLLGKVATRAVIVIALALVVTLAGAAIAGVRLGAPSAAWPLALWTAVTVAYALFWFAVALVVNAVGRSSSTNALAMLAVWLVVVVVVPSMLAMTADTLHPTPSRVELLTAEREASNAASERGSQLLAMYYQDHPELMTGQAPNMNDFASRAVATSEDVARATRPLRERFDTQLAAQQALVSRWRWLSPAVVTQLTLLDLAGTGDLRYTRFRHEVDAYVAELRAYFLPMIARSAKLTRAGVAGMPSFDFEPAPAGEVEGRVWRALIGLFVPVVLLAGAAVLALRRRSVVE